VTRVVNEQKRVESDLEKSERELREVLSRMERLRRQRDLLRARSSELVARGMREFDEEDGVRSQEEAILEEQQAAGRAQELGAFGVIDWSSMIDTFPFDDTVATGAGSSSGV
jgi:hypothetical protein